MKEANLHRSKIDTYEHPNSHNKMDSMISAMWEVWEPKTRTPITIVNQKKQIKKSNEEDEDGNTSEIDRYEQQQQQWWPKIDNLALTFRALLLKGWGKGAFVLLG